MEPGAFDSYLKGGHGSFAMYISHAVQASDNINLNKLGRVYPQVVAAYKYYDRSVAPPNFEPKYNGKEILNEADNIIDFPVG